MGPHSAVVIEVQRLEAAEGLPAPRYMTPHAAGMDLYAALQADVTLKPGARALVPTGLKISIPQGFEGQIRPRSGLALKNGISLLNAPGTIDADYRGEVKIIIANLGQEDFIIRRGDRIAQLVICPVARAELQFVEKLPESARGEGGFGHSG